METDLMWRGDDMKPTLTVFDVRDEAQGYENCPQVKTQTLKTGELETKQFTFLLTLTFCFSSTHVQEGAGGVCHHDGGERPEFQGTPEDICGMKTQT